MSGATAPPFAFGEAMDALHELAMTERAAREALQQERDTLMEAFTAQAHRAQVLLDRALQAEAQLSALRSRVEALADECAKAANNEARSTAVRRAFNWMACELREAGLIPAAPYAENLPF